VILRRDGEKKGKLRPLSSSKAIDLALLIRYSVCAHGVVYPDAMSDFPFTQGPGRFPNARASALTPPSLVASARLPGASRSVGMDYAGPGPQRECVALRDRLRRRQLRRKCQ
jgi:hypothetical protein